MKSLVSAIRGARTPAQTTTPVPYAGRAYRGGFSGLMRPAGQETQIKAVGANGTLFAIVNKYASATAAATWHLNRQAVGRNAEPVEVASHAALDLWNSPNAYYTRPHLIKAFQQHRELVGEGILVIVKIGNLPIELWPVRPDRMEPVPHPEKFLAGWIYHGPDGQRIPLAVDQVIQIQQQPCPWDPYHGLGAVQTILTDLHSAEAAAEWNRMFFANSAEPGGIVEVDRRLSDDEFNEMTARWREQHQGVNNAHKVAILEQVKWVPNAFSMRDMQFVELRGASSQMIREAFAFPKTMLGDIEDVNRASAEAETYIFTSGHIVPRLDDIQHELNFRLLPMYGPTGRGLEFAYDSPVPEDREADDRERTSQATAAATLVTAGFDAAAVLEWAGLPAMAHKPPPTPAPAGAPGRAPAAHQHGRTPRPALPPARNADDDEDDPEPDLSGVLADLDEALDRFEQQFVPILAQQIDALVEQVETAIDEDDLDQLTALAVPDDLTGADLLRRALGDLAAIAAQRAARECAAQGVDMVAPAVDEDLTDLGLPDIVAFGAELVEIARVTAELAAAGLAGSAAREALRHYTPGAVGRRVAGKVRDRLEALKGSDRTAQVGAAMHRATNLGRGATFAAALKLKRGGKIFASEQNDANACEPCRDWDGHEFATLAEAREMYDAGGYPDCLGRERCRGTYWVTWRRPGIPAALLGHNRPGDHPINPATGDAALRRAPLGLGRPDSASTLSDTELAALRSYKGSGYRNLNKALRTFEGNIPESTREILPYADAADAIDGVMERSKLTGGVEVHRGIWDGREVFGGALDRPLTGAEWVEHAYVSASASEATADEFQEDGPAPLKMRIRAGRGISAVELSGAEYESELLFQRGLTMRVLSDTGPGADRVLDVVVMRGT